MAREDRDGYMGGTGKTRGGRWGAARARLRESRAERRRAGGLGPFESGPTRTTFLPWLLMGLGALSHLLDGRSGNPWLGGFALLAFNSLYISVVFAAFDPRRRDSLLPVYALGGLALVTYAVAVGYGSTWLLFFPLLGLASGCVRRLRDPFGNGRFRRRPLGAWLILISVSAGAISGWKSGTWESIGIGYGTFISGAVTSAILSLFETVTELKATRQELARTAVEKERLRFSRDLHDLLGHTLSVVVVKAEAVRRLGPRDLSAAMSQAADIEAVGRQALTEIREAVSGYREGSLAIELERAGSALEAAGIEAEFRQSGPPLSPQAEALLGWVVREGVTNAVRHSGAGRCEIDVRVVEDRARLTVTDDGRGPVPAGAGPGTGGGTGGGGTAHGGRTGTPGGGNGLKGLAERLTAAGGTLDHGPDGRRGFRVVAELPVDAGDTAPGTSL